MDDLFTSRREIENLMQILQDFMNQNPEDSKNGYAQELFNKLDYLCMVW